MLVIGNKKYRNLQEQVGWNTEQIEKIFQFLDGINVSDNVVVVTDISTPLTTEELEIVNREVAFIVYNGELYFKKNQDASYIYFDIVFKVSGSTVITLASSEITVTKSNGALGIVNSSVSTYSKSEVDSLLSAKANTSYVDSQLALKANLSGANFTGAITGPSIIEDMVGYSADVKTATGPTPVYAGIVKNGNKLTLAYAFEYEVATLQGGQDIIDFIIPASIGQKLFPSFSTYLEVKNIQVASSGTSVSDMLTRVMKPNDTTIRINIRDDGLSTSTKYYCRIESTFLLSDNLAS